MTAAPDSAPDSGRFAAGLWCLRVLHSRALLEVSSRPPPRRRFRELSDEFLSIGQERQLHRARLQGEGLVTRRGTVKPVPDERKAELRELAADLVCASSE